MDQYFGTYEKFLTVSKKEAAELLGADNLVGDRFEIEIEIEDSTHKAWLRNRFGKRIGYFEEGFSRKLSILRAQGLTLTALLSFVAFTDLPEPGFYWGQMAVIGYNPNHSDVFEKFINNVADRLCDGVRPRINFEAEAVQSILDSDGNWLPSQTVSLPEKKKGTAIVKSRRSVSEKLIEQGRKGNKGCYVISWAFIILVIAALVFGLKSCGLF